MPDGGRLTLEIGNTHIDHAYAASRRESEIFWMKLKVTRHRDGRCLESAIKARREMKGGALQPLR